MADHTGQFWRVICAPLEFRHTAIFPEVLKSAKCVHHVGSGAAIQLCQHFTAGAGHTRQGIKFVVLANGLVLPINVHKALIQRVHGVPRCHALEQLRLQSCLGHNVLQALLIAGVHHLRRMSCTLWIFGGLEGYVSDVASSRALLGNVK